MDLSALNFWSAQSGRGPRRLPNGLSRLGCLWALWALWAMGVEPARAEPAEPVRINGAALASGQVILDSGWRFFPDMAEDQPPDAKDPRWQSIETTFATAGEKPPGPGWFDLRLEVIETPAGETPVVETSAGETSGIGGLALGLWHQGASEVFLGDRRIARFGTPATELGSEEPYDPRGKPVLLPIDGPGMYRLSLRYSCLDSARPWLGPWLIQRDGGGFTAVVEPLDQALEDVLEERMRGLILNFGLGAVAFGFAFLHGVIFFFYRRHRGNLWFSLFAVGLATNGLCSALLNTVGHFGLWGMAIIRTVNLLAAALLLLSLLLFLTQLKAQPTFRAVRALALGFGLLVAVFFLPPLASAFGPLYLAWMLAYVVVTWTTGVAAWRRGAEWGWYLRISAAGLLILIVTEVAKHGQWIGSGEQAVGFSSGILLILAGASLFLARRIADEGRQLEELAEDLEGRVKERTRELELSNQQAQAASVAKSRFLATMSHEIRTPMNAVVGLAELLGQADIPAQERKMVGTLRRSAVSLLRLIDEILDLSRIESGSLTLRPAPFPIEQVLDDVQELFGKRAEQAGLTLRSELRPEHPPWIVGDRDRFYQILINLVGNALKFTHEGGVTMTAELTESTSGDGRLRLEVADTGIGIAEEDQKRLFDPFFQIDSSNTRRFGGAGLGLAICKRLADLMDAELAVASAVGRGTRFTLDLEVEVVEKAEMESMESASAEAASSGAESQTLPRLRILLAEDNAVNQWVVQLLLEELGQEATLVEEGPNVLSALAEQDFDVVILDLHMPGMDGFEVARQIREREQGEGAAARLYIIAFTASVMEEDRRRCREVGMDDFLSKPADLSRLREALASAAEAR